MGFALSQNGLCDRETGEQLDNGTERDIYRILELPWLEPSERQPGRSPFQHGYRRSFDLDQ